MSGVICRLWVKAIGDEDLVYVPIEKLHQLKYVCDNHFSPEDFTMAGNHLKQTAVPTLNLPEQSPEHLLKEFPYHIHPDHGHQSTKTRDCVLHDITNLQLMDSTSATTVQDTNPGPSGVLCVKENEDPTTSMKATMLEHNYASTTESLNVTDQDPTTSMSATMMEHNYASTTESLNVTDQDTLAVAGPSAETIVSVKSYKRKQKSLESKDSHEEDQEILKLSSSKLNLEKIAKTSLNLDSIESTVLRDLINAAVINENRKSHGKRWTLDTKVWALAIFKRSPKTYRFLQASLPLPCPKTITRLLKSVSMEPGINSVILETLKQKVMQMKNIDKYCCILFDEISLKKRLYYNEGTDKVEGYVDLGDQERKNEIADHALVFMIQGLAKKYKQPIAYYFVKGTISSAKLSVLIKEIIKVVNATGLKVVNTVCDQGPTNMGALSLLKQTSGETIDSNYFIVDDCKIYIVFDVPHLFKSIRNNFFNAGEMSYDGKTAKWAHLVQAENRNRNFLNFPKITQTVVQPTYKIKMKVKYAAHALSNNMSAVLKMLSWRENDKSILQTAEVIEDLDKLFDLTNSPNSKKDTKKNRVNVSSKTSHVKEWKNFITKMDQIKFNKKDSQLMLKNVRCINGYKTTLKSLVDIWLLLQNEGFRYLNLRQLNQD